MAAGAAAADMIRLPEKGFLLEMSYKHRKAVVPAVPTAGFTGLTDIVLLPH